MHAVKELRDGYDREGKLLLLFFFENCHNPEIASFGSNEDTRID